MKISLFRKALLDTLECAPVAMAVTIIIMAVTMSTPTTVPIASAACPLTTGTYFVTAAATIDGCIVTDVRIEVNMGLCTACALVIDSNIFTNQVAANDILKFNTVSPGGTVTITNNIVHAINYFVRFHIAAVVSSVLFLVQNNQVDFTMNTNSNYHLMATYGCALTGTTHVKLIGNTMSFVGVHTNVAGIVVFQVDGNFQSPSVTVTAEDNLQVIDTTVGTNLVISNAQAYRDGASDNALMHIIVLNIFNNVPSANFPTILVKRNTIRYTSSVSRPRVSPQVMRIADQSVSFNDITVSDNIIDFDVSGGQVANVQACMFQIQGAHVVGGKITLENNYISLANFFGFVNEVELFIFLTDSNTLSLTLNGATTIRNNTLLVADVSSVALQTAIPQLSSAIVGSYHTLTSALTIGATASMLITNNTNEARRVAYWRRISAYTGVPFVAIDIMYTSSITTLAGSTLNISHNTLISDVAYKGFTTNNGATFTVVARSFDALHSLLGRGQLIMGASNVYIAHNSMNTTVANLRNSRTLGVGCSAVSAIFTGTTFAVSENIVAASHLDVTGHARVGLVYSNQLWSARSSAVMTLSGNAVSVTDSSVGTTSVSLLLLDDTGLTVETTSALTITGNRVNHTLSRPTVTLTTLFAMNAATTLSVNCPVVLSSNAVWLAASKAEDSSFAHLDAVLVASGSAAISDVHAVYIASSASLLIATTGTVNVTNTSVTVRSDTPRPAFSATLVSKASPSGTTSVAGIVAVEDSIVDVEMPVHCRLWGELDVGGIRFPGTLTMVGTGKMDFIRSTVTLAALDDVSIASPNGNATCSNQGTVTAFGMRISSLVSSGAGGANVTCSSNTVNTRLDGRTYLRGSTRLADITMGSGNSTVTIADNTLITTTGTSLTTLNTATMTSTYSITPVTLCGGNGIVSVQLGSGTVAPSGSPSVAVRGNTIGVQATQEAWGVCSFVRAGFNGTAATTTLVDVSANTILLATSTTTSLTSSPRMVSLNGTVVRSPDTDFAAVRENRFQRTIYAPSSGVLLSVPNIPALIIPVSLSVTAGAPLRWWACRNIIELFRTDGGSNASHTIRSFVDVQRTSVYDPAQHVPTHCFTNTLTSTRSKTTPRTYSPTHTAAPTPTLVLVQKPNVAAVKASPLNSAPVLASSSAVLGAATVSASEGAASLQVLVIITTMSCRTQAVAGTSRSDDGGSSLLSPVSIPGLGPSREMVGSLILAVAIILGYFAITHTVFAVVVACSTKSEVVERLWKARLYTFYPRLPVIAAALLLPGIVFDGASLLYGDTSGEAAWWERLLGAVAIVLSALLVVHHIAVGRFARLYIMNAMIERTTTPLASDDNDEEMPTNETSTPFEEKVPRPLVPSSAINDELQSITSVTVMGEMSSSHVEEARKDENTPSAAPESPKKTAVMEQNDSPPQDMPPEELPDDSINRNGNPFAPQSYSDDEANINTLDRGADGDTRVADGPSTSVFLTIDVWLSQFTTEERAVIPVVVRLLLLPRRRWAPQVGRTMYCILTSLRPEAASYVAAHSILRVFLVGMLAAANPQSKYGCTVVESLLAGICFIHGIAVFSLRIFRVSTLTVLQGLQSFVLGLVAIIPYMGGDSEKNSSGLTYFMIALIAVEIACSVVVLGLEMWLERRSHKQTSTMDNLQFIAD